MVLAVFAFLAGMAVTFSVATPLMALFLVLSIVIGFGLAFCFAGKLENLAVKRGAKLLICVLGIVCVLFNGICCYYLIVNDSIVKAVVSF